LYMVSSTIQASLELINSTRLIAGLYIQVAVLCKRSPIYVDRSITISDQTGIRISYIYAPFFGVWKV
jgi:hypothetical protein